jgi:Predicted transcriptional regulator
MNQNSSSILRRAEVERLVGLSRSSLYRLIERGEFPRPLTISSRAVRWRADEIATWIEARTAQRDGKGAA